jgi:Cu(I)/Ag(I) efflux system membrane fusion protein
MKYIRIFQTIGLFALLGLTVRAHDKNAPLNDEQKAFLSQYESVRAALAADDLVATRKAAAAMATESKVAPAEPLTPEQRERQAAFAVTVKKIATADSLEIARDAFKQLSKRAVHLAEGKPGYYVAHCPMVSDNEGVWIQTSKEVANPYFGKAMLTCGSIK